MKKFASRFCPLFAAVLLLTSGVPVLGVPVSVAAAETTYEEPLTGTRITFPDAFDGGEVVEQADHRGRVHTVLLGQRADVGAQIDVSVREIYASSIADVLNDLMFSPDEVRGYEIHTLSENELTIYEESESFGEKTYSFHRAWLLNDDSYLYVGFQTTRAENRELYRGTICEFGVDASELTLKTNFDPSKNPEGTMAGNWVKEDKDGGKISLEVYLNPSSHSAFLRFHGFPVPEGGRPWKYARYDTFWESLHFWEDEAKGNMRFDAPDEIVLREDGSGERLGELAGTYARAPASGEAGDETPVDWGKYRGKWENDTVFTLLTITRGGISLFSETTRGSWTGHIETDEGLEYADRILVSRTDDGGLKLEDVEGTFYRVCEGKGVERYAAFAPFRGSWENPTAGLTLNVGDGAYSEAPIKPEIDNLSFVAGNAGVSDGILKIGGKEVVFDPETDTLTVEGVEGVYRRVGDRPVQPSKNDNVEIKENPLEFGARDADLSDAPDVIVEGNPPNLGGWHGDNVVAFYVEVEEEGYYIVTLNYSKQASDGDTADLKLTVDWDSSTKPLPPTGKDWSNYADYDFCVKHFPAGKSTIIIESTRPRRGSYVMNLRSVRLSREE